MRDSRLNGTRLWPGHLLVGEESLIQHSTRPLDFVQTMSRLSYRIYIAFSESKSSRVTWLPLNSVILGLALSSRTRASANAWLHPTNPHNKKNLFCQIQSGWRQRQVFQFDKNWNKINNCLLHVFYWSYKIFLLCFSAVTSKQTTTQQPTAGTTGN